MLLMVELVFMLNMQLTKFPNRSLLYVRGYRSCVSLYKVLKSCVLIYVCYGPMLSSLLDACVLYTDDIK